jgi:hypothetical protein
MGKPRDLYHKKLLKYACCCVMAALLRNNDLIKFKTLRR